MSVPKLPEAPTKLTSQLLREEPDLRDIVEEFVTGLPLLLAQIQQAVQRLDWQALATLAHRLKGAGGSYGYPEISRLCADAEEHVRAHDVAYLEAWLPRLAQVAAAAQAGLANPE